MDPVTHVTAGLLISQLAPGPSRAWSAVAGVIFTLLPDIDWFLVYWDRLAFIRHHRGFSHSLLAVLLFALLVAALGRVLGGPRWFKPLLLMGLAILGAHLLLDLATSYGTQLLNPISQRRFALDWLFIIDPYFTAVLLAGAAAALASPAWGRRVGAWCLAAAGGYLLVCALFHLQAMVVARQVFPPGTQPDQEVAALPQPFSPRRWLLLAASPGEVRQAFVELPAVPWPDSGAPVTWTEAPPAPPGQGSQAPPGQGSQAPPAAYRPPQALVVHTWKAAASPGLKEPADARKILDRYLEFARFPLLYRDQALESGRVLEWLDLRFSVPGRPIPFGLQLQLDAHGRLEKWGIGRGGGEQR